MNELFWINMARISRLPDDSEKEKRILNLIDIFGCQPGFERLVADCMKGLTKNELITFNGRNYNGNHQIS